jgi:hypothetical protein
MWFFGSAFADEPADTVRDESADLQSGSMQLLLGWSVGNLVTGGVGAALTDDPELRAFALGNAAWNTVNLGIAVGSLASLPRTRARTDPDEIARGARSLENALLVNGGLDLAYLGGGVALLAVGKHRGRDDLRGYGESLLVQGAFLLAFDSVLWARHRAVSAPLR